MRRMVTVKEPRAKPKYTANGDVLLEKEISVIKAQQTTMKELGATLKTEAAEFFEHAWVAHHQAQKFDECIDKLPADSVAILLDYSMNYPHEHMDQTQSEWWSSHQSTILPAVSYYRDKHGTVWARSHVYAIETKESDSGPGTYHYYRFSPTTQTSRRYMSPDPNHSNAFVQHVLDEIVNEYKEEFKIEGRDGGLQHVHVWSDGCAAQESCCLVLKQSCSLVPCAHTNHARARTCSSKTAPKCIGW